MKRVISLLLTCCILLASLFSLSSCFLHEYQLSDEWVSDEESHWRVCTNRLCNEISDKADHTYDAGEVTVKPTQEADGVTIRTCTVCGSKKEQSVLFTGLNWTEWNAIFLAENFANFTYHERAVVEYQGIQVTSIAVYKFTETEVYASLTSAGSTSSDTLSGLQAAATKKAMIESMQKMLEYSEFEYDRESKSYILTGTMKIENIGNAKSATLRFKNGKPETLVYTCTVYSGGIPMECESTITFSDFGTTKIK